MKDQYKELDRAISRLKVDADKINELLAEVTAYEFTLTDELEDIRDNAYCLLDACDATEDESNLEFINIPPD